MCLYVSSCSSFQSVYFPLMKAQAVTFDPLWSREPPSEDDYPSHLTCGATAVTVPSWGHLSADPSWGLTCNIEITEDPAGLRWSRRGGRQPVRWNCSISVGLASSPWRIQRALPGCDEYPNQKRNLLFQVSQVRGCGGGAGPGRFLQGFYGALIPLSFHSHILERRLPDCVTQACFLRGLRASAGDT